MYYVTTTDGGMDDVECDDSGNGNDMKVMLAYSSSMLILTWKPVI